MNPLWALVDRYAAGKRRKEIHGFGFNCQLCVSQGESRNDTRQRGSVGLVGSQFNYHCHNCKFSIRWDEGTILPNRAKDLLESIGVPSDTIKELAFNAWQSSRGKRRVVHAVQDVKVLPFYSDMPLPFGAEPLENWVAKGETNYLLKRAVEYLYSRGPAVYSNWKFYWTPSKDDGINERLIIPAFEQDRIVGWTARLTRHNRHSESKYFQKIPPSFFFNSDAFRNWTREIVIVQEGPLDAIVTSGAAFLTNDIGGDKLSILKGINKEKVLIPDRGKAGQRLIDFALENHWSVSFPPWEDDVKDPCDAALKYGRLYTVKSILDHRQDNKLRINLLRSKW